MNRNALVIMAKRPNGGSVKTRLKGHLSDEKRLALYVSLLEGTIVKLKSLHGVDTYISFAPESAGEFFSEYGLPVFPQATGDIGDRMFHAAEHMSGSGYEKVAIVGADIPDISGDIALNAFTILDECDIVFGPARDGGYYLVGMKRPIREIFSNIQWSSEKTLKQSVSLAKALGFRFLFTETLDDIDTIEDAIRAGLC